MVSVCPVWQHGQSFSVFTFSTRGVVDLAEAFLLVRDFQNAFRRGSSSSSTSTNKISIYEGCLFKRGGFPCLRSLASEHPTTLFPPLQLPTADYGGTKIVVSKPTACCECGSLLMGEDEQPQRHQVTHLPRIEPEIVEYQRHAVDCLVCGARNQAEWPADMPKGSFSEEVQALTAYLGGRFGISKRDIAEISETVFHIDISLGSISAQEQRVSQALKKPMDEALEYVDRQTTKNMDETSWHELMRLCWLWVCVTPKVTVFQIFKTRGASEAKKFLGENFVGILGSDRYSAYNWIDPNKRQACWAHLKRDFQTLLERGGESATVGRLLLDQVKLFFALWHHVKSGTLSRIDFQTVMVPIRSEVNRLLLMGIAVQHTQTHKTCRNIHNLEQALWTFVDCEGIEPTNNVAERALRRCVIWRRRSFGTQSEGGSRFVERITTTVSTLRQQKRDVLEFLVMACRANLQGLTAPSLLPAT